MSRDDRSVCDTPPLPSDGLADTNAGMQMLINNFVLNLDPINLSSLDIDLVRLMHSDLLYPCLIEQ